jgi:hypothetical protein
MISIRSLSNCIALPQSISILWHFYGFRRGIIPTDPTGADVVLSLRDQTARLSGKHYHINIIKVGSDQFTDADHHELDYAIHRARQIYGARTIGIGRVGHYSITTSEADGLDAPDGKDEVEEMTERWYVDNDGIDVFIPIDMSNAGRAGRSPDPGPCEDKDKKYGMDGSVAGIHGFEQTARTFSHELGHYLGLGHKNNWPDNLMCQSDQDNDTRTSVQLTSNQANEAKEHCLMQSGC